MKFKTIIQSKTDQYIDKNEHYSRYMMYKKFATAR